MGKPSGLKTARKLRFHRRDQRWHDLGYKKAHLGTRWKANPFGGSSHAKGRSRDFNLQYNIVFNLQQHFDNFHIEVNENVQPS